MDNRYTWTYMSNTFKDMYKATNVQCLEGDKECYNAKYTMDNVDVTAEENQLSNICPLNNDPQLCCDSSQKNSGEVINVLAYEKVKPTYDEEGDLVRVEVCNCGRFLDDRQRQECIDEFCVNFRDPTIYETCKIDDGKINSATNTMDALLIGTEEESNTITIEQPQLRPDCGSSCTPPKPKVVKVPPTALSINKPYDTGIYEPEGTQKTVSLVVLVVFGIFLIIGIGILIITSKKKRYLTI